MENDSFTEVTRENWFSRIGSSIKGIFFGIIFFIAAFPLLWWNEGRSVERYNSLKEGQDAVVSVSSDNVDSANNSKLVHIQGLANTQDVLRDDVFGISATAIKLIRNVSMYQWQEDKETETVEKVGGTKETRTTYSYRRDWIDSEIDSSSFKQSAGHNNPPMYYRTVVWKATRVMLGAFNLNSSQIDRIVGRVSLSVYDVTPPAILANKKVTVAGDGFYLGANPSDPQIGDMRINFQVVNPAYISLIAQQQGNTFSAYQTKAGGTLDELRMGMMDASAMFAAAQKENTVLTWAIRIGGTLMMWIGLSMVFKPLSEIGSILPFLGNLIAMGTGILAFLITIPCAMVTIALAWIAYRPLLAGALIGIAVIAVVAMKFMPRKNMVPAPA